MPALKVTDVPLPVSVPSAELVRAQTYVMPEEGHAELHAGVAVKGCVPLGATVGVIGLIATELMATTVMIVEVSLVKLPSVALTYIPTVPPLLPAVKVTEVPLPLSEPKVPLVRAHR
jgi:hypothetical protein